MIVSRQNPKLKSIRRLHQCKGDRAVLEGPHLIAEARRLGLELETVLATPDFLASPRGSELAAGLSPRPLEVAPPLLRELSDVDAPQGILAVAKLARAAGSSLPVVEGGRYLFAEGLQDPGNLGALARSAEASGVAGLALGPGSAHPNHPRALRASAGSLLRLPVVREATPERLADLQARWLALVPRGGQSLFETDLSGTLVLALGSEGGGLGTETRERCDLEITIPIDPEVESLNATVAAAVVLFEIHRRRLEVRKSR
jgi:TrmH family RNA methyltransferase